MIFRSFLYFFDIVKIEPTTYIRVISESHNVYDRNDKTNGRQNDLVRGLRVSQNLHWALREERSTFDLFCCISDYSFTLPGIIIYNDVRRRSVVVFKWSSYTIDWNWRNDEEKERHETYLTRWFKAYKSDVLMKNVAITKFRYPLLS